MPCTLSIFFLYFFTLLLFSKNCNNGFQTLRGLSYGRVFLKGRKDTKKMFSVTVSVCFCCCLFVCLSGYKLANRKKNLSTQLLPYLMELLIFLEGGFMSVARLLKRLCLLKTCVFTGHTYIAYK